MQTECVQLNTFLSAYVSSADCTSVISRVLVVFRFEKGLFYIILKENIVINIFKCLLVPALFMWGVIIMSTSLYRCIFHIAEISPYKNI